MKIFGYVISVRKDVPRAATDLSEEELGKILVLPRGDVRRKAMRQVFREYLDDCVNLAAMPENAKPGNTLLHTSGNMDAALALRERFETLWDSNVSEETKDSG